MRVQQEITFGARVLEVISDLGMNQRTAAKLAGIDPGRLSHIIQGQNHPTTRTMDKMTSAWHVPPFVFYVPRHRAEAEIQTAKNKLKNSVN